MTSMLRDVGFQADGRAINADALRSEIRQALINDKVNACPIACRYAWHASGVHDATSGKYGSDGATIRFSPESEDPANAGLGIIRDLLHPVKLNHPEISHADLITFAGVVGIELLGGPSTPFGFGRSDAADGQGCPANGNLPDAAQGAEHLRQVFGRMGFNDQEIVALSGAHTLGRCHVARSGFDGAWTTRPLAFDNEYYRNLVSCKWAPREWDGPLQYEDESGKLMMLPTDMALIQDGAFRPHVEAYANDNELWQRDFAAVYGKLLALGCPQQCQPGFQGPAPSEKDVASAEFREHAMHGSVVLAKRVAPNADVHSLEATSGRSALHKAAFWGHVDMVKYLLELGLALDAKDSFGDTALHDACRFGHNAIVGLLLEAGAPTDITNGAGLTPKEVAVSHGKESIVVMFGDAKL